jgi:hypothetical protein
MNTATIGFTREDGDFEILATMNNTADHFEAARFAAMVQATAETLAQAIGHPVEILERQDAPDTITTE